MARLTVLTAFLAVLVLLSATGSWVRADVITTGDITPGGTGTQSDPWTVRNYLYVGYSNSGTLEVEEGSAASNTKNGYLGYGSNATGLVTITGSGSHWNNSSSLYVGYIGSGTLNIEAGGTGSSRDSYLGHYSGSTGVVTVTNSDSQWNNSRSLSVGVKGSGTLNIESGGVVANTHGYIAHDSGSTGMAKVSGSDSQWNNSQSLNVGAKGSGTLNIEASGEVSNAHGYIGNEPGSTGIVTVTDSDSQWNNSKSLSVGAKGSGTLNIEASGEVSNTHGYIGNEPGSTGTVTVTGADSQWNNSGNLTVGNFSILDEDQVPVGGTGTLNVEAGGVVSNTNGYIGTELGSTGVATIAGSGSQWTNSTSLYVGGNSSGSGGVGTLNLYDSGLVTVADTTKLWDTGTLNLAGGNLTTGSFNNSDAGIFNFHDGTLTVNGAGEVFDPGTRDFTINGNSSDDTPHLVIANTASTAYPSHLNLIVGDNNQGALTIQSGGNVRTRNSYIGDSSGSTGEVTATGSGSHWNNSNDLSVGSSGTGTLNVKAGGVVSNTIGYIGKLSGSTGTTTVTGSGSHWNNSSDLSVGSSGTGTLNVKAGGVVSNTDGYIGKGSGSTGVATVNGNGSVWNNRESLYLGGQKDAAGGSGTISVLDNGTLSVMGNTVIWNDGTLKLGSGTFTSSDVVMKGGKIVTSTVEGENGFLFLDDVGAVSGFGDISLPVHLGAAGSVQGSDDTLTLSGGLIGSGTVMGVTLGGAIDIGGTPGTISLADVVVNSDAVFKIEIAGTALTDYDRLLLAGVTIAGNLEVELINEFMPQVGDTFNLLNLAPDAVLQGNFNDIVLPVLTTGLWDASDLLTNGNILIVPAPTALPGDTNNDNQVTSGDLITIQQNYGTIYPSDPSCDGMGLGDANKDCVVTGADLLTVQQNFGNTQSLVGAAVPEPSAIGLLALAGLGTLMRRR